MSLRNEPQSIEEHIAYLYELLRKLRFGDAHRILSLTHLDTDTSRPPQDGEALVWDEGQGRWKPQDVGGRRTLMWHAPGVITAGIYESFVPVFGALNLIIRGNCTVAPAGGDVEFYLRVDGVATSTLPMTILDATTVGIATVPDLMPGWMADAVLDIEVVTGSGASGLVVSIEHTRISLP